EGIFSVTDILNFDEKYSNAEILKYAASLEINSEHPLAKGILEKAEDTWEPEAFNSITGKGIEGKVNGKPVKVVSPGYIREHEMAYPEEEVEEISSQGKTVVFVIIEDTLA